MAIFKFEVEVNDTEPVSAQELKWLLRDALHDFYLTRKHINAYIEQRYPQLDTKEKKENKGAQIFKRLNQALDMKHSIKETI